ncbi:MAG: AraC family transcriptional regulator [Caecibacter sp.]|nr:AraC family transcriptional regulator [Caecibacter sp.]
MECPIKRPEIKKTVDYIHRHLGSELTLRTISEKVYLSESYLSKLFKQEMNMNLMQYINQCRIEEAKRLLQSSNLSVEAIGRQLGYRRTSYFCKMFKSFTSVTPHAYRKKFEIR